MCGQPLQSNYASYGEYLRAAVGYAVLTGQMCAGGDSHGVCAHVGRGWGAHGIELPGCVGRSPELESIGHGAGADATTQQCIVGVAGEFCHRGDGLVSSGDVRGSVVEELVVDEDPGSFEAGGVSRDCVNDSDVHLAGSRLEKNRRNRQKAKERKMRKRGEAGGPPAQSDVPLWRSKRVDERKGAVGQLGENSEEKSGRGFFSACSSELQVELRESRARMLIAENKRKEAVALEQKKKLDSVTPEVALVTEMIRITRMANQLKKQTKDQRVGGWAETVADTLTRSTAESAPSSMPSLKSVEEGSSALKSDGVEGVFDQARELRMMEYNVEKLRLDHYYEQEECVDVAEQTRNYSALKKEYADISMSEVERENAAAAERIAKSMSACGIDEYKIQMVLEAAGFDYDLGV